MPKKKRQRAAHEAQSSTRVSKRGVVMTCQNCLQTGHNVKSCKAAKKSPAQKVTKKVGRPKKMSSSEPRETRETTDQRDGSTVIGRAGLTGLLHVVQ